MSRYQRIDSDAARLAHRLDRASITIPGVRDHIDEQRRHARLIGSPSSDEGRSKGGHSDPTLATVMERDRCDQLNGYIDDALESINVAVNLLDDVCRQALGYRRTIEDVDAEQQAKPRCIGDQFGKECWNVPSPRRDVLGTQIDDGRCIECGPAFDRHRADEANARRARRHKKAS